ncbi:competence/damage-inducible protein A [Chlamydiota bacterium]
MNKMQKMNPVIELVSIGTELLSGTKIDEDFIFIADGLRSSGYSLAYHSAVGDDAMQLSQVLKTAIDRADIVITTGGLGPTTDDISRDVISEILKSPLIYSKEIEKWIRKDFLLRKMVMPESNLKMAYKIKGSEIVRNSVGNAPGLIVPLNNKKWIFLLPGPPGELVPMFSNSVLPFIKEHFFVQTLFEKKYRITGLPESEVQQRITDKIGKVSGDFEFSYLASPGNIDLKICYYGKEPKELDVLNKRIKKIFGKNIYSFNENSIEEVIGVLLRRKNKTLALAESCTGGITSSRITDVSGSSDYFLMGIITYGNESKISQLKIDKKTLDSCGAVSKEVAVEMSQSIKKISKADIGISITGIAGPTGGTRKKPVGFVWFGLADKKNVWTEKKQFNGDRKTIKLYASGHAMNMIRLYLLEH